MLDFCPKGSSSSDERSSVRVGIAGPNSSASTVHGPRNITVLEVQGPEVQAGSVHRTYDLGSHIYTSSHLKYDIGTKVQWYLFIMRNQGANL